MRSISGRKDLLLSLPTSALFLSLAALFSFFRQPFFVLHPNNLNAWKRLIVSKIFITRASIGKPESKNTSRSSWWWRRGELWSQQFWSRAFLAESVETGDEDNRVLFHFITDRMLCFAKKSLARIAPYTFISHAKMSIVFGKGRFTNYIA